MPLTRKARTRLVLLVTILSLLFVAGMSVWFFQQYSRDQRATEARADGLAAIEAGDYKTAVKKLGFACSRFPNDVELLLAFADARGRVESPFGNHLQRCLDRYVLAVRLCKQQKLPDETLLEALIGRGRLERIFGQSTRLRDSAMEILALDPSNVEANEYLLQLSYQTGDYLPADPNLVVCGNRRDLEWRDALRDANEESSLRWALELMAIDPENISRLGMVVDLLTLGESEARQQLRWGETVETTDQILDQWAEAMPNRRQAVMVLKAQGYLRERDIEEARSILQGIDSAVEEDPIVLVGAASMLFAMGGSADQARASELLARAESMVSDDPAALVGIARQYWTSGRTNDARSLLDGGIEAGVFDGETGVDAFALLLLSSPELPDFESLEEFSSAIDSASLALGERERFRMILGIVELLRQDPFDATRAREFLSESMNWRGDVFIGTLMGDLVRKAGLPGVAAQFYQEAIDAGREYSAPLSFRLAESLLGSGDPASSFTTAVRLAGYSPNLPNMLLTARAWIGLERIGVEIEDLPLGMSLRYDTPRELLEELQASIVDTDPDVDFAVESLIVAAAASEGDVDFAAMELDRLLADTSNEENLVRLLGIANRFELEIAPPAIERVKALSAAEPLQKAIFDAEATAYRRSGDRGTALDWIREEYDSRPSDITRRALAIEILEGPKVSDSDLARAYRLLAECENDEADLRRMLTIARSLEDEMLASKAVEIAKDRYGESSNSHCFIKGLYVLGFHRSDTPESRNLVNETRDEIGDLVASGMASIDLYGMLARLWYEIDSSTSEEAISILELAIERSPDHVASGIYLARCLQESQRPDEADSIIQQLYQNRERFTPVQRTMLAGLLVRQGRDTEFASSICEVADRTGAIEDLLSCMEVRRNNGQQAVADSILDRLAIRADRTVAVEEAVARRLMRLGQADAAIEGIERSVIIQSEVIRTRMIASLLMASRRWEEAAVRLEALIEASEETPGVSEVMLATCLLNGEGSSDRDDRVIELLDAAAEANPTSRGMLRRIAAIAVGSERISSRGPRYIDRLREVDVDQAEFLDLGFQFQNRTGPEVPKGFIARARSLTERLDIPLAWSLYLDILSAAFQNAARKGDFDAIESLSEQLDEVSFDYTRSFPGIFGPLNRRVRILMLSGDVENARLVAFESIASIEKTLELRDVLLLARIDGILGRYEAVSELLQPFKREILAAPGTYRISAGLLLEVAVHLGNVEEALRIYDQGVQAGIFDANMTALMRISENVDPEIAIRMARALNSRIRDPRDRFGLIGMLLVTSVRTGDERVALEISELLSSLRASGSADELLGFQVACLEVEVLAPSDPIQSFERTAEIIEALPPEIRSTLLRYQEMSEAERNEIVAYAFPVAILSNNLVARVSNLLMEQGDDSGITTRILEMCGTANDILSAVLPDDLNVLDTRARYLAAMGETSEALAMIGRVLADAPLTSEYLVTKAEILSLAGDGSKALEAARQARIAGRIKSPGDEQMSEKIEDLITRLR